MTKQLIKKVKCDLDCRDKGETYFAEIDPLRNDECGQKQAVEAGAITLPIFHKLHRKMKVLNGEKG